MFQHVIIEKTEDGSDTLFVPELNEHYHSVHGATTESNHVFIDAGLMPILEEKKHIRILEIGFGTGLNALLTILRTNGSHLIHYTGIELYPLPQEVIRQLDFALPPEEKKVWEQLHTVEWNEYAAITDNFHLKKWQTDVTKCLVFTEQYDLIYFDAFAPDIQPAMWTPELFESLFNAMNDGGILTTYCAKGQVRRNMQQAGFTTERLPGPPGKREMLRARKCVNVLIC